MPTKDVLSHVLVSKLLLLLNQKRVEREKEMTEKDSKWIQGAIKHVGALRKMLHVAAGKKIPEAKLEKAEHSKNPTLRKRAVLAETLKKLPRHHGPREK